MNWNLLLKDLLYVRHKFYWRFIPAPLDDIVGKFM